MAQQYSLVVKNLKKTFPNKELSGGVKIAVDNISFSVKKGEIFGLLGVNGAGKSTTISMLCGLTSPDSGAVNIFGKNFFENEEECKSRFNIATAYYHLHGKLTVKENLNVFARLYNIRSPKKKIEDLCSLFMIKHLYNTLVYSLSSGEKSRLVLVKSLLNDPELLFLDECTVGLDPDMAEITREHLEEYNKKTGCTIIFTSHYMQEVERLCHRIAFMDEGKIVKTGTAKELSNELSEQEVTLHISSGYRKAILILEKRKRTLQKLKGKILRFTIPNKKRALYPILEELISSNVVFDDIHLNKPTLEDYFIARSRK